MAEEFKIRANAIEADIYIPESAIIRRESKDGYLVLTMDIDDTGRMHQELVEFF